MDDLKGLAQYEYFAGFGITDNGRKDAEEVESDCTPKDIEVCECSQSVQRDKTD
jgi:hypothetical protein